MNLTMPPLHSGQLEVKNSSARFKVLSAGRRWGKSRLGAALCIANAIQDKRAWWISPTYPMSQIGWREIKNLAKQVPGVKVRESDRIVQFGGQGYAQVKSSDNPDSLRGEGLDFVALDECAYMKEETWTEALRPALSDRKGSALFISTPKGRNFFWRIWQRGLDDGGEWQSWKYPTAANPFIDPGEIEAAKGMLVERVFMQEYLAEFLDMEGAVFRRILEASTAVPQDAPTEAHQYIFGVDWARTDDATVFVVLDVTTREIVYLDRMTNTDYNLQRTRLRALYERFLPGVIIAEYNSMGGPQVEELQRQGLPIQPFTTTNATKAQAIDALALAFEQSSIKIPNDPILIGELQAYESERLPSGMLRYSAPEGMHDDTVMALALAWQGVSEGLWLIS